MSDLCHADGKKHSWHPLPSNYLVYQCLKCEKLFYQERTDENILISQREYKLLLDELENFKRAYEGLGERYKNKVQATENFRHELESFEEELEQLRNLYRAISIANKDTTTEKEFRGAVYSAFYKMRDFYDESKRNIEPDAFAESELMNEELEDEKE